MTLRRLQLRDFRNYAALDLELEPGISVFAGANGQGKTNILEAVCYLGLLRSFRTLRNDDLRRTGARGFTVEGELELGNRRPLRLAVGHQEDRRHLSLNHLAVARVSEFIGQFLCVPFVPEDAEMLGGAASERRRFLDISLCQSRPPYLVALQRYLAALKARNAILRRRHPHPQPGFLQAYDTLLVREGTTLIHERHEFIGRLNAALEQLSPQFFHDGRQIRLRHACTIAKDPGTEADDALAAKFAEALKSRLPRDLEEGHTRCGPHRDDLEVELGGRPVAQFASGGERRIAALALRLAALGILREEEERFGGRPVVLLLDDVFGELDEYRRSDFFAALRHHQILVACTRTPPELEGQCQEYAVHAGTCERRR